MNQDEWNPGEPFKKGARTPSGGFADVRNDEIKQLPPLLEAQWIKAQKEEDLGKRLSLESGLEDEEPANE
jgi:hypothetical protein